MWCIWDLIDRRLEKHCFWPNSRAAYLFSLGRDPYTFKDILEDLEYHPFKFDSFLCWTLAWQKLRGPFIALCLQHKLSGRKALVNAVTMENVTHAFFIFSSCIIALNTLQVQLDFNTPVSCRYVMSHGKEIRFMASQFRWITLTSSLHFQEPVEILWLTLWICVWFSSPARWRESQPPWGAEITHTHTNTHVSFVKRSNQLHGYSKMTTFSEMEWAHCQGIRIYDSCLLRIAILLTILSITI